MENQSKTDRLPFSFIADIGKTLTSSLDLSEVLRTVLQNVSQVLQPSSWTLLLSSEEGLRYEILINQPSIDRNKVLKLGDPVAGLIAQAKKPCLWPCPDPHPDWVQLTSSMIPKNVQSILAVPLVFDQNVLGVIELWKKAPDTTPFSVKDLETLSMIADFTAVAIQNAKYFERVQELTITDDLTGLANFRQMQEIISQEVLRAQRYNKDFSLIFLDLDHFKAVNDTWGHMHGSQLLQEVAIIIKERIRLVDAAARYGGDEFVVMLPETDKVGAIQMAERLRDAVEQHTFLKSKNLEAKLTASFGVANFPQDAQTKEQLMQMADDAMYKAKKASKNKVESV